MLAAAEAAIKEVIRALAIEMPRDTASFPLRQEVTASVHQDLGKELHVVPGFPDLPHCCHIMIIKRLVEIVFLISLSHSTFKNTLDASGALPRNLHAFPLPVFWSPPALRCWVQVWRMLG